MPLKNEPNLLKICSNKVSQLIVRSCLNSQHCFSIRNLLNGKVNGTWKVFSELRMEYNLPIQIEKEILEKSLELLVIMDLSEETAETVYILIHYFCLGRTSPWNFELKWTLKKSLDFLLNFNSHLKELTVTRVIRSGTLEKILLKVSNIAVLDMRNYYGESFASVIGKYCLNLQQLKFSCSVPMNIQAANQLCFADCPEKLLLNPLCKSLRFLESTYEFDALNIVMDNLRNVKIFQNNNQFDYFDIISNAKPELFPHCNLEFMKFTKIQEFIDFKSVFWNLPKLISVSVQCKNIDITECRTKLEVLMINCHNVLPEPSSLVSSFVTPWPKLRTLFLVFLKKLEYIDFSSLANNCPNLETLTTRFCVQKSGCKPAPFQKLQNLMIYGDKDNLDLLNYTSRTLETFMFSSYANSAFDEKVLIDIIKSNVFLCLKNLIHSPLFSTRATTIDVLNHCDTLEMYGPVADEELRMFLMREAQLRNWKLNIWKGDKPLVLQ